MSGRAQFEAAELWIYAWIADEAWEAVKAEHPSSVGSGDSQ